jgi:hypothetical protein
MGYVCGYGVHSYSDESTAVGRSVTQVGLSHVELACSNVDSESIGPGFSSIPTSGAAGGCTGALTELDADDDETAAATEDDDDDATAVGDGAEGAEESTRGAAFDLRFARLAAARATLAKRRSSASSASSCSPVTNP